MNGKNRSDIKIGLLVDIVLKKDQSTGKLTRGHVKKILTNSSNHPHGIKVMLEEKDLVGRLIGMGKRNRRDVQIAHLIGFTADVRVSDIGVNRIVVDRKIGGGHDARQHFLDGVLSESATPDGDVGIMPVEGFEKRKPHNVIPVRVRQQQG